MLGKSVCCANSYHDVSVVKSLFKLRYDNKASISKNGLLSVCLYVLLKLAESHKGRGEDSDKDGDFLLLLFFVTGLEVNDQLVPYAPRSLVVRLKNNLWSHQPPKSQRTVRLADLILP